MRSSLLAAAAIAAGLTFTTGHFALAAEEDRILATVDGDEIRNSHVMKFYENLPAQYKQAPLAFIKGQLIEQLINMRLISKAATDANITESQDYLDRVEELQLQLQQDIFLSNFIKENITDEMIKAEYDKMIADIPAAEETRARHILLKEEQEAKDIIKLLDEGGVFAELAAKHSTGPTKTRGGDLGYFAKGRMVPEFSAAADVLEAGTYTKEPVKTQFGWHIIKVEDRRAVAAPTLEEKSGEIRQKLTSEKVTTLMSKLKEEATIVIVQPEQAPAKKDEKAKTE